jgi:hypothetical protein
MLGRPLDQYVRALFSALTLLGRKKIVKGSFRCARCEVSPSERGAASSDQRFSETLFAVDDWTRTFAGRPRESASNRAISAVVDECG